MLRCYFIQKEGIIYTGLEINLIKYFAIDNTYNVGSNIKTHDDTCS